MLGNHWLWHVAENGLGTLQGGRALAARYAGDTRYADANARIAALIRNESAKHACAAAASALVSNVALPFGLTAGAATGTVLRARVAIALALLLGASLDDRRVRTVLRDCVESRGPSNDPIPAAVPTGDQAPGGWERGAVPDVGALWVALGQAAPMALARAERLLLRYGKSPWAKRFKPMARALPLVGAVGLASHEVQQFHRLIVRLRAHVPRVAGQRGLQRQP